MCVLVGSVYVFAVHIAVTALHCICLSLYLAARFLVLVLSIFLSLFLSLFLALFLVHFPFLMFHLPLPLRRPLLVIVNCMFSSFVPMCRLWYTLVFSALLWRCLLCSRLFFSYVVGFLVVVCVLLSYVFI